jgi:hypothetical protein
MYPQLMADVEKSTGTVRVIGRPFPRGKSGNPGGRPKGAAAIAREVCGGSPRRLAEVLLGIVADETARERDRIAAATELWDRGWGKAPAYANIEDGNPLGLVAIDVEIQAIAKELERERLAHSREPTR